MTIKEKTNAMILDEFVKYSNWTIETSKHKDRETAIVCCLLGLIGEVDEYEEIRFQSQTHENLIKKELGDIAYYLAHLIYRLDCKQHITLPNIEDFFYDKRAEETSPFVPVLAKLCESFKKVIRDADYVLEGHKKEFDVYSFISQLFSILLFECQSMEFDFLEILTMNQEKLTKRKEQGTIGGSGNER